MTLDEFVKNHFRPMSVYEIAKALLLEIKYLYESREEFSRGYNMVVSKNRVSIHMRSIHGGNDPYNYISLDFDDDGKLVDASWNGE